MAFQPFGYKFEVHSPFDRDEVRSKIRRGTTSWFDPATGPRGWILGPFVCLWSSAFNKHGPMIFGRMVRDGWGTRISGRAGSDLNGVFYFTFLTGIFGMAALGAAASSDFGGLLAVVPMVAIFVWFLWDAHKERGEAEGLVRFLEDRVGTSTSRWRPAPVAPLFAKQLSMDVNGSPYRGKVDAIAVRDVLNSLQRDEFLILSSSDEEYAQTLREGNYFKVEKRVGDRNRHAKAIRRDTSDAIGPDRSMFTRDEVLELLWAFGSAKGDPDFVRWSPIQV